MFDLWRAMAESSNPAYCPDCDQTAQRVFSAPAVLSGSLRLKQESREPQLVKREVEPKPARVKSHTGSRPWMIGH